MSKPTDTDPASVQAVNAPPQNPLEEENRRLRRQLGGYKALATTKERSGEMVATPSEPVKTPEIPHKKTFLQQCGEEFDRAWRGEQ